MNESILTDFDFSLLDSPDFKEDSVREELILPILKEFGYSTRGENKIIRSKTVTHPFVKVGTKKRELKNYPDYLLEVAGKYAWVLDAKAPSEEVKSGENVEQAYFYAIHQEIRVNYFALCNGKEFIIFHISQKEALLYFHLTEIEKYWAQLEELLAPTAFAEQQTVKQHFTRNKTAFDYLARKPLSEIKSIKKQSAKRHFGVHGYFTRQAFQILQAYISNFTNTDDVILDPYGGSGVTLVEALMLGRKAIHIDLNPLSVFIVSNLIQPVNFNELIQAFEKVKKEFVENAPRTEEEIKVALEKYPHPRDIRLMKNADVDSIEKLFSPLQLAQLAYLKHLIEKNQNATIKNQLLLSFSSTITKINLTYHPSSSRGDNAGDCAAFRYYRFRIAAKQVTLDVFQTFAHKIKKLIAAKKEIANVIDEKTFKNAQVYKGTATNLDKIGNESVDYIYTDPPYGAKIPYLDLSLMWSAWLDLEVTEEDYKLEAIEGGEHHKTKDDYSNLIAKSIEEMYRVLKFDRWMSFVFQHQDPAYWHLIKNTAEKVGFEYAGTVIQNNGQKSFKKRQNPFTVLSSQLIINFKKVNNPKTRMNANLGADVTDLVYQAVEDIIVNKNGATIDEINNELTVKFWELDISHLVAKKYNDLTEFIGGNFDYDKETQKFYIKRNIRFKAQIPIEVRIKYYLISMMRQLARERKYPSFDEITFEIMPLLQNGITPEKQTIRSVLEDIAVRVGEDRWKLKEAGQGNLFDLV